LFAHAAYLAVNKRTREALAVLHELAKVDPHHLGLWRFKARLYAEVGETKFASLCAMREDSPSGQ
jgi:Flp pilus assembly protein TadD